MIRLADFCYRRRRIVLLAWVIALIVVIALGSAFPAVHRANYRTPGAEATKGYDLLNERFPARQGDSVDIVFAGPIADAATRARFSIAASVMRRRRARSSCGSVC